MTKKEELPIISFKNQKDWEQWLSKNHDTAPGVWIKIFKKGSQEESINYDQALDEALCYGWIDGQAKSIDEKSYKQRFTPRRPKGMWSKRNTEHIARLTKLGKMKPSGIEQVELAKKDGRWGLAYESSKNAVIPDDFMKELNKNKKAKTFFETLNKTNTFYIFYQLETAKKPETRERRMKKILETLGNGKKFH